MFYKWLGDTSSLLAQLVLTNKKHPPSLIERLSIDIVVECIFPLLHVEEIICLRRVNKLFYALTHEPLVWRRILRRMTIPMPPIVDIHNAEQQVTRAITVDDNFRGEESRVLETTSFYVGRNVLDTKLLLGGKYLVMSVARPGPTSTSPRKYGLAITQLDSGGAPMFASSPLETRAYSLDAKYMTFNGHNGIMVSYIRRTWALRYGPDLPGGPSQGPLDHQPYVNLDDATYDAYSGEKYPQEFELVCKFIPMRELEAALNPNADYVMENRDIFKLVAKYCLQTRIWDPILFELDGHPHVGFVTQPRYTQTSQPPDGVFVMRIDGPGGPAISFGIHPNKIPAHQASAHRIRHIRVLPEQRQILIIRTAYSHIVQNTIELYDFLPYKGTANVDAAERLFFPENHFVRNFHISDDYRPSMYPSPHALFCPPPISMYMMVYRPRPQQMHHVMLWPSRIQAEETDNDAPVEKWVYVLEDSVVPQTEITPPPDSNLRFVPGVHRCLLWGHSLLDYSSSPKPIFFDRYVSRDCVPMTSDIEDLIETELLNDRKAHPDNNLTSVMNLDKESDVFKSGISSITWDETIGRACYVSDDGDSVTVLDFSSPGGKRERY